MLAPCIAIQLAARFDFSLHQTQAKRFLVTCKQYSNAGFSNFALQLKFGIDFVSISGIM